MKIEINKITDKQVDQILQREENHFFDLKSKDILPSSLSNHLSAFANTDGGELYIGINEDNNHTRRYWDGFATVEAANNHIRIFDQMFVFGQFFHCVFLSNNSKPGYVLKVDVFRTPDIKKATDGKAYVRRGAQTIQYSTPELIERLKYDKGITSFETQTIDESKTTITNSLVTLDFLINQIPSAEPEAWLKKQQLIRSEKPTVAGLLLFAEEPQAMLPKRSSIKIYRYSTDQKEGTRETLEFTPLTIEGDIYSLIKKAVEKTTEIVESVHINTPEGLKNVNYPKVTLHEVITNAVLHRDYSIPKDVHIRIFDNRIDVESPGKLPGHVSVKNILNEQFARNGSIVRIINKFPNPPNQDVGEGLNTAFNAMRNLQLKDPMIVETESSVIVTIKHESLASPEERVLQYLKSHATITNGIARSICYIGSENTMKNILLKMVKNKILEKVPNTTYRGSAYQLPRK